MSNTEYYWEISWEKVKTHEDVLTILKNMAMQFSFPTDEMKKLCICKEKDIKNFFS